MDAIQISQEQLAAIYADGNSKTRSYIREILGRNLSEVLPVTERVKTFEDAIAELGEEHSLVKSYYSLRYSSLDQRGPNADLMAYAKLRIITTALNEGWEPQFTPGEYRWYGWYELLTKEEMDAMSDEDKKNRRVVGRANFNAYASGGLVFSLASNVSSLSLTYSGSRLAFKSEELAKYAAKQFIEIYADFCFIPENTEKQ